MVWIHTPKRGKRARPNGKIVRLEQPDGGTRIADERSAEKLHRRLPGVLSEPAEIPCTANRKPDKDVGF